MESGSVILGDGKLRAQERGAARQPKKSSGEGYTAWEKNDLGQCDAMLVDNRTFTSADRRGPPPWERIQNAMPQSNRLILSSALLGSVSSEVAMRRL